MTVKYLPLHTFQINNIPIRFGEGRSLVRSKLASDFTEQNQVFGFGDPDELVHQRRDVYKNIHNGQNFFFLGYDKNDLLSEIEIHDCDRIKIIDILFGFEDAIDMIASRITEYSNSIEHKEGEYFFKDLKCVLFDKERMGGEGNSLGYFYCTSDTSHLE